MTAKFSSDLYEMGQNIAQKRRECGFSQEQFSEAVGMSRTGYGNIERGTAATSADVLISVCRILKTTPNEVFPSELSGGQNPKEGQEGKSVLLGECIRLLSDMSEDDLAVAARMIRGLAMTAR